MIINNLIFSLRFHVDCKPNRVWSELTCMSIHQATATGNSLSHYQELLAASLTPRLLLSPRW